MTRTTTGHPARAQRILGCALALWLTYRAPAIQAAFDATRADLGRPAVARSAPSRAVAAGRAAARAPADVAHAAPGAARRPVDVAARGGNTVAARPPGRAGHLAGAIVVGRAVLASPKPPPAQPALAQSPPAPPPPAPPALARPAATATDAVPALPGDPVVSAGDLATAAYARLAAGDRRGATRLFAGAVGADDPRAATWRRQRDRLLGRWSGSAYSLVRAGGMVDLAATPVLGGGQSGGRLAYSLDPLGPRPVALMVRAAAAHDDAGRSAFAAVGVEWRPLPGVTVAAERLIAVGPATRGDWTVRVAAGAEHAAGRLRAAAYGEAGRVGRATYAAVQARAGWAYAAGTVEVVPGVGGWASLQHDHTTVDRVDVGPSVAVRAGRFGVALDYRVRVAGNAAPGTGPVLTLGAAF